MLGTHKASDPHDQGNHDKREYILEMIEQLASLARAIDEMEIALHLDATVAARRFSLARRED